MPSSNLNAEVTSLNQHQAPLAPNGAERGAAAHKLRQDLLLALSVSALLTAGLVCWFSFDHHNPTTDEAGHVLSSIAYGDLLRHSRPLNLTWWHKMLTVSTFYPPSAYIIGGVLKLLLHESRSADVALQAFYCATLSLSTFACARMLGLTSIGAAIAALVIGLYPGIVTLNHSFFLDLPLASMVAFGMAALLFWYRKPTLRVSLVVGLAVGFACLTKQLVACFLFAAAATLVLQLFLEKRLALLPLLLRIGLIGLGAAAVALPWVVTNIDATIGLAKYNRESMAGSHNIVQRGFLSNLAFYGLSLIRNGSPWLFAVAFLAMISAKAKEHKNLLPVSASAAGGILLISTLNWCDLYARYTMSALIAMAIYTGLAGEKLIESGRPGKFVVALTLTIALLQYLALYFTPYPLANSVADALVTGQKNLPEWCRPEFSAPVPRDAWGAQEALDFVEKSDHSTACWLNIMINQAELNAHTLQLLVAERNSPVRPTTSLQWTLAGDKVDFSPATACYYQWYLLKTGTTGYKFFDNKNAANFDSLIKFVTESGKFHKKWTFRTPDGQYLSLYRQE